MSNGKTANNPGNSGASGGSIWLEAVSFQGSWVVHIWIAVKPSTPLCAPPFINERNSTVDKSFRKEWHFRIAETKKSRKTKTSWFDLTFYYKRWPKNAHKKRNISIVMCCTSSICTTCSSEQLMQVWLNCYSGYTQIRELALGRADVETKKRVKVLRQLFRGKWLFSPYQQELAISERFSAAL